MAVIGGVNLVKIAIANGLNDLSLFRDIGTCEQDVITDVVGLEKFLDYHLVWYKPNSSGQQGWLVSGSNNYKANEYIDCVLDKSLKLPGSVLNLMDSLSHKVTAEIEILVAKDTNSGQSLIVDGTKRAIALLFLKNSSPDKLELILKTNYRINIFTLKSKNAKVMFPCDFLKL